jgi:hypothetical protein
MPLASTTVTRSRRSELVAARRELRQSDVVASHSRISSKAGTVADGCCVWGPRGKHGRQAASRRP